MKIELGDQLDSKYRVLKALGDGGFGEVFLAEDTLLNRKVAIKRLNDKDPKSQASLVEEMKALDRLHHPGVVAFYHHFIQEGLLFLVMEYCDGGSLRDKMDQQELDVSNIMQWGVQLTSVLELVHKQGIVHHDIKPDNLLFTKDGQLKLGDFGAANGRAFTTYYMAPEWFLGAGGLRDERIDVYALGITLLELIENRNPFWDIPRPDAQAAKLRHSFIPSHLDRWVQEVIAKATHPTPELRFQTMGEFREAIEAKHVNYVFDRGRIQACALAAQAERYIENRKLQSAGKAIQQALFACPDSVPTLIAAGRRSLFLNQVAEARQYLDQALALNPRANIQRELGWISLESGRYSQAISLLTDHLQRKANDYEAFNLLLECFYRTGRYEAGIQLADLMIAEKVPSSCFESNRFLCQIAGDLVTDQVAKEAVDKITMPFIAYNLSVNVQSDNPLRPWLLFQTYRLGLRTARKNTVTIEIAGRAVTSDLPIISVGRLDSSDIELSDSTVSRRHCVIVNFEDDVWIHDLESRYGVIVDGRKIDRKVYVHGVHVVGCGKAEFKISSKLGLLA